MDSDKKPRKLAAGKPAAGDDRNLRKRLARSEFLLGVTRKVASLQSLDQVFSAIVDIAVEKLNAERGTIFLHDASSGELYSRVAQGALQREIRILGNTGIAGYVFTHNEPEIIHDAYADPRFNQAVDQQTGYVTQSMLCVPMHTAKGEVIGIAQVLNKKKGRFTRDDLHLLQDLATQSSHALQAVRFVEEMQVRRRREMEFLNVVTEVTRDIKIGSLLQKVMQEVTRMLNAERSTLFLNDEKTNELWSEVGQGLGKQQIRFPNHLGIAGAVFSSGQTINIPYAYADLRFNPAFDKQTGFFTRSILCVPVVNQAGKIIGVTQALNKRGGTFSDEDESRLRAFTAQVAIALENATLFANVQNIKNYNESMLESMSSGVLTLDDSGNIVTCNQAGLRILQAEAKGLLQHDAKEYFAGGNAWILDKLAEATEVGGPVYVVDGEVEVAGEKLSVNVTAYPLNSIDGKHLGSMIMLEDITSEKRMKSTMSRYMDPNVADKLLASGADLLGGQSVSATVLFSDIRGFTTITEKLGAQGTVSLLNEYFTLMMDCLQREGGMLDKYIGDAIMASFGILGDSESDEDRAVRCAIDMIRTLHGWNAQRAGQEKLPVNIGVGINTDTVVSGNIGSPKRMDFTVIGDGVNLASRLESACKEYGAQILVSETTFKSLKGTYRAREIDYVVVKGKTQPVSIYEVLDYHDEQSFPNIAESLQIFKEALIAYRHGQWDKAHKAFAQCLELNPADKAAQLFVERCEHLKAEPPEGEWHGVWVMKSK
ncbi:MAG: GAF domain-containing protein [Betaproteobacteria bacterium]|nr:GAF domain-containing protein [Betaproteobacteria bacterium]